MTKAQEGLSDEQVLLSREKHGENKLSTYKRKSFLKCFLSNLSDPIIKVLIGALLINVIFMFPNINWFESGGILSSIIIATLVSTISEYSSENSFEKLREQGQSTFCVVVRGGEARQIRSEEVVVGDILMVSAGESMTADSRILHGSCYVDESALTGESCEVYKEEGENVLKGSLILSGEIKCVAESVGEQTYYGKVARELREETRPSPLKKRLTQLAKSISRLGYLASLLIALAYLFNVFVIDSHFVWSQVLLKLTDTKFLFSKLLYALTLAVSIIVVAVPEGLPMMITVVLSSNMKKMMKDNVLVRKLIGIETSGNISLLFTDKTGTLTEGRLRVKELHAPRGECFKSLSSLKMLSEYEQAVRLCATVCNGASYDGKRAIGSDATDRCVMEFFKGERAECEVISASPFDSTKKYSSVRVKHRGRELTLYKGAPEKLLSASKYYLDTDGQTREMSTDTMSLIHKRLKELTDQAYRVVALATGEENMSSLCFVSLLAIRDRVRREVNDAIKQVSEAGVGVIMITGDNPNTARAIAKECGIISPYTKRSEVLTGGMLEKMSDEEIKRHIPTLAVIARALPSDKSRLVRVAQEMGYVVGMTGDGINDASSLKGADVGFGMGSGTEVAKEACDIVIGDNNFASIVKAILYGRTIFESIRKFIIFQLTMNFGAVGISLIGPFIGIDNPVTVTQMLWVNIIMDTLGALAFASEPHLKEYMKMKPKSPEEKILSYDMMKRIALTSGYVLLLCVWFLKSEALPMLLTRGDERYILSAFFAMFIFTGIFVCFTSRTTRINILSNLKRNRSFSIIMLSIATLQMAFIYFGGETFRATPLRLEDLITVIAISFTVVIFDFIRKLSQKYLAGKKIIHLKEKRNVIK
ncbi:MAG: calcium-translocating P-type ATPase, PMCA-type [Clostridia bacterium]|nr:calcium-translocating P-type ATPase, PMCA-type [Clostridia bacterium]